MEETAAKRIIKNTASIFGLRTRETIELGDHLTDEEAWSAIFRRLSWREALVLASMLDSEHRLDAWGLFSLAVLIMAGEYDQETHAKQLSGFSQGEIFKELGFDRQDDWMLRADAIDALHSVTFPHHSKEGCIIQLDQIMKAHEPTRFKHLLVCNAIAGTLGAENDAKEGFIFRLSSCEYLAYPSFTKCTPRARRFFTKGEEARHAYQLMYSTLVEADGSSLDVLRKFEQDGANQLALACTDTERCIIAECDETRVARELWETFNRQAGDAGSLTWQLPPAMWTPAIPKNCRDEIHWALWAFHTTGFTGNGDQLLFFANLIGRATAADDGLIGVTERALEETRVHLGMKQGTAKAVLRALKDGGLLESVKEAGLGFDYLLVSSNLRRALSLSMRFVESDKKLWSEKRKLEFEKATDGLLFAVHEGLYLATCRSDKGEVFNQFFLCPDIQTARSQAETWRKGRLKRSRERSEEKSEEIAAEEVQEIANGTAGKELELKPEPEEMPDTLIQPAHEPRKMPDAIAIITREGQPLIRYVEEERAEEYVRRLNERMRKDIEMYGSTDSGAPYSYVVASYDPDMPSV